MKRVNIVAMGASCYDFVKNNFLEPRHNVLVDSETWAVAQIDKIFIHDRAFDNVQGAIKTAIAEGAKEIGLWGCDYRYPGKQVGEDGEEEVVSLIRFGKSKGIEFFIPSTSECLLQSLEETK